MTTWRLDLRSAGISRGFSLIEIIVGLGLVSIVISSLMSVLLVSNLITKRVEEQDKSSISAIYSLEYLKDEIKRADKVYTVEACPEFTENYPNNFGFILMETIKDGGGTRYNYKTYYMGDGTIKRIAYNHSIMKMPTYDKFSGYNTIAENVISIEGTGLDLESSLINICLEIGYGEDRARKYIAAASVKGRVSD